MSSMPMVRIGVALSRANARSLVCWVCLLCAAAVQGQPTDTSWFHRMEIADDAQWGVAHGTRTYFARETDPRHVKNGSGSMRAMYCLGTDQGCEYSDDNFYSAWMKFRNSDIQSTYNTFFFWVKRDNRDPHDRDICPGFNIAGVGRFDAPFVLLSPADTVWRLVRIPLVCFRAYGDPTRQMPAGTCWEECFGIGARDTIIRGGIVRPMYSGKGTLWLDDMGFCYDREFPSFPGPYISFCPTLTSAVGIYQGMNLAPRQVVSRERLAVMTVLTPGIVEPGTRLYDLNGRRLPRGMSGSADGVLFLIHGRALPQTQSGASSP